MNKPALIRLLTGSLLLLLSSGYPACASDEEIYKIGFLDQRDDPRYTEKVLFARYLGHPVGRPVAGAEVAIREVRFHGAKLGVSFALEHTRLKKNLSLRDALLGFRDMEISFVIVDLDASTLIQAATLAAEFGLVLFNVSASEDSLREQHCSANVFHVLPSDNMIADSLAQYLVAHKWKEVLALVGPLPADALKLAAFQRAAKRYGLKISEVREFVLGTDPRMREKNNPRLLTQGGQDVIFIADSDGEFARQLPYRTVKPNPIVGSEGLAALAWHWSWDRHGAPQLENRFEKKHARPMGTIDWAAWMAVKIIAKAVQTGETTEKEALLTVLVDEQTVFDGFKGNRLNFRRWNNQLRQPLLLSTHNWVVDRAPVEGFLHQTENLDTLGIDQRESRCEF